jgi:hypothetical protein
MCKAQGLPASGARMPFFKDVFEKFKNIFVKSSGVLSGWTTIELLYNLNETVKKLPDLIKHIDKVVGEISHTLTDIRNFIQKIDDVLDDIHDVLKNLPKELGIAFDASEAKKQMGLLRGQSANMASVMVSRESIHVNARYIEDLSRRMVETISTYSAMEINGLQFTMQVLPALSIWVTGYTAYNALRKPKERDINPWEHQMVVSAAARVISVIEDIRKAKREVTQRESAYAVKVGVVYKYDETANRFIETSIPYKRTYKPGEIDSGHYYCLCPRSASASEPIRYDGHRTPPRLFDTPSATSPDFDDIIDGLSYLVQDKEGVGYRYWGGDLAYPDRSNSDSEAYQWYASDPNAADLRALTNLTSRVRLQSEEYGKIIAIRQLAHGIDDFEKSVRANLMQRGRTKWQKMPVIPK